MSQKHPRSVVRYFPEGAGQTEFDLDKHASTHTSPPPFGTIIMETASLSGQYPSAGLTKQRPRTQTEHETGVVLDSTAQESELGQGSRLLHRCLDDVTGASYNVLHAQ